MLLARQQHLPASRARFATTQTTTETSIEGQADPHRWLLFGVPVVLINHRVLLPFVLDWLYDQSLK